MEGCKRLDTENKGMKISVEKISVDLPKNHLFFDWASASILSKSALSEINSYNNEFRRTSDMPLFIKEKTDGLIHVREVLCNFLSAPPEDQVIFARSATEAINMIALGLRWNHGDEIVISSLNHLANILPWQLICELYGCKLRVVNHDNYGLIDLDHLVDSLSSKTRMVAITHISHLFGTIQPVDQISQILQQKHNILLLIDGAQSVGRIPIDLSAINCDFFVGTGRKALLAPLGSGFLLGKKKRLLNIRPIMVGTRNTYIGNRGKMGFKDAPEKFEANLPDMACLYAMAANVKIFSAIGPKQIYAQILQLDEYFLKSIQSISHFQRTIETKISVQSGIHSFRLSSGKFSAKALEERLRVLKIIVAAGEFVRISLHIINKRSEIDVLIRSITNLLD